MLTKVPDPPPSQFQSEPVATNGYTVSAPFTSGALAVLLLNVSVPLLTILPADDGEPMIKLELVFSPDTASVPPELIVVWFQTVTLSALIVMLLKAEFAWLVRFCVI